MPTLTEKALDNIYIISTGGGLPGGGRPLHPELAPPLALRLGAAGGAGAGAGQRGRGTCAQGHPQDIQSN